MKKETKELRISPAKRVETVQEYYFSRKLKEIAAMRADGCPVINLGVGSPDLAPSAEVVETLCTEAVKPYSHAYQPYTGIPALREAFAQWYQNCFNVELNPADEILPLIGSKEGVLHISMAFLNPGDEVLIPNPGYPTYQSVTDLIGAKAITYDLTAENGWMPDFEKLESMDLSRVKMMWVNYPNMPTGTRATREVFERLIRFGREHGILICNDNPYSFILNDEQLSILQCEGAKDVCIELNSLSKSHNMSGWRIGMVAGNAQFIQWILRVKSNVDSGQFKPMQEAAIKALLLPKSWYDEINAVYAVRRQWAERIMTTVGCTFDPTQAGLFLWAEIPKGWESAEALSEHILHGANVFLTPGFIFGSQGHRYLRISLCCDENQLREAHDRIAKLNKTSN